MQHKCGVERCQRTHPVRDDDDNRLTRAQCGNGLCQCRLPLGVEIGIRFVENDQKWLAVYRPREANPLTLAAGEQSSPRAYAGGIAVR